MDIRCGILGLPNVGKSTFFNGILRTIQSQAKEYFHHISDPQEAKSGNYPFCTIEPNVGTLCVPDPRLHALAKLNKSETIIPTVLEFHDIAGLVKGASQGLGLGNQFLGHIRQVDALIHIVRCFEGEATHVEGSPNPLRDMDIIESELVLADLESVERRLSHMEKKYRQKDPEALELYPLYEKAHALLENGVFLRHSRDLSSEEKERLKKEDFLSAKPMLYLGNVEEGDLEAQSSPLFQVFKGCMEEKSLPYGVISAQIEWELSNLPPEAQKEFLEDLGIKEGCLNEVVRRCYRLLDLETFFTAGPKEARAWTVKKDSKAPEAAGKIHKDFQRGFIAAEVISFEDYSACGGETQAKAQGKLRTEGKNYTVQDGDVIHFRFNV